MKRPFKKEFPGWLYSRKSLPTSPSGTFPKAFRFDFLLSSLSAVIPSIMQAFTRESIANKVVDPPEHRGFGALSTASFLLLIPVGALGGTRDPWGKQENRPPAPPSPLPPFPSAAHTHTAMRCPRGSQPHACFSGVKTLSVI